MAHIRKFNEEIDDDRIISELWKNKFRDKSSSGRYWKELFGEEFENHKFLDSSDAVSICKMAQRDVFENVINELEIYEVDSFVVDKIKAAQQRMEDEDNSGLSR